MKRHSLRSTLAIRFALLVLAAISLISIVANIMISREFEEYLEEQQKLEADDIAQNISSQYRSEDGGWNIDYVHGMGMYALEYGFIIKLHDKDGKVLWDAEHHDMTLCHEVMQSIAVLMQEEHPNLDSDFVTHRYNLKQSGAIVGYLDISYYSPYYMNENDFQFITALNRILVAVGSVSLIGAVIMGVLLANSIVKPVSKVVEITQKISDGDYSARFKEGIRTKELHELRTPVANISSYMEMMTDGIMEPTPELLELSKDECSRSPRIWCPMQSSILMTEALSVSSSKIRRTAA